MSESSGFLSRWALRKQQAQQGEVVPEEESTITEPNISAEQSEPVADISTQTAPQVAEDSAVASVAETADDTEDKLLTAEDLPDPSGIEIGGSFASFMGKNVDPGVRQAALRTLWKQPHFSEIDGMMEYALDYSNQEILTPEVSSELAKKVFRHLVKDEPEAVEEVSETQLADAEQIGEETTVDIASVEVLEQPSDTIQTIDLSDKMDGEFVQNSQNDPLTDEKNNDGVV